MQNKHLQVYLDRIEWGKKQFTPDKLEIMLAASCLRFLGGQTDLDFVLELSEKIRRKQQNTMSMPLRHATAILHALTEELDNNTILSTDKDTIEKNLNNVQRLLLQKNTLRSYPIYFPFLI